MAQPSGFDLKPGSVFNERYQIVRPLSIGGMGAVYEAMHLETRRRRALKLMHPELLSDPIARARFKLEAQVAANIESEHIVEVVDAGVDARTNVPFIVMELLRGQDLGVLSNKRGKLPAAEVVDYLAQAARALDRTHAAGIVHRDLKPENLFSTQREDGSVRIKVLDFGIAKVLAESRQLTRATATLGTPVFMAPEQISGDSIGPAADIYALAHIAYALLCGAAYWDAEAASTQGVYPLLLKIAAGAREPAVARARRSGAALPPSFEPWFRKATAFAPGDRFATAGELVIALAQVYGVPAPIMPPVLPAVPAQGPAMTESRYQTTRLMTASGATIPVPPERLRAQRRRGLIAAFTAVILGGLALGTIAFLRGARQPSPELFVAPHAAAPPPGAASSAALPARAATAETPAVTPEDSPSAAMPQAASAAPSASARPALTGTLARPQASQSASSRTAAPPSGAASAPPLAATSKPSPAPTATSNPLLVR